MSIIFTSLIFEILYDKTKRFFMQVKQKKICDSEMK